LRFGLSKSVLFEKYESGFVILLFLSSGICSHLISGPLQLLIAFILLLQTCFSSTEFFLDDIMLGIKSIVAAVFVVIKHELFEKRKIWNLVEIFWC
jgi:hypothetical protein